MLETELKPAGPYRRDGTFVILPFMRAHPTERSNCALCIELPRGKSGRMKGALLIEQRRSFRLEL